MIDNDNSDANVCQRYTEEQRTAVAGGYSLTQMLETAKALKARYSLRADSDRSERRPGSQSLESSATENPRQVDCHHRMTNLSITREKDHD